MAKIKRTRVELSEERRILSNMITSSQVLSRLQGIGEARLFESPFARTVATWVWEFYAIASEAPGKAMEDIFRRKSGELDEDVRELVGEFLQNMSAEWESSQPVSVDYAIDTAKHYFQLRSLHRLKDQIEGAIEDNNPAQGAKAVGDYRTPERPEGKSVNIFTETQAIQKAFRDEDEVLFTLGGDVGKVVGPFIRGDFPALMAPPKRGKTWWMMWLAYRAALAGHTVLFISLEMEMNQMIRRFWQMIAGQSRYGEKTVISHFEGVGDGTFEIVTESGCPSPKVELETPSLKRIQHAIRVNSRGGRLLLENYPTNSFSVKDLKIRLNNLATYDNIVPPVVVVDYADIMAHTGGGNENRHQLNYTWTALRGLAQEFHNCLISASQSGRKTVDGKKDADASDIAEDIRKLAHVTKLITLNQSKDYKQRGIYSIACENQREGASLGEPAIVCGNLAIGRPVMDSRLLSRLNMRTNDN